MELRFTADELAAVQAFARSEGLSLSDAVRIGTLNYVYDFADGEPLAGVVQLKNRLRRSGLSSGSNSGDPVF